MKEKNNVTESQEYREKARILTSFSIICYYMKVNERLNDV